ncbi:carbohydrate ABC transporter permease [Actinoplanes sp. TBRC 11911]|uniref:carbohydrate ABC transporter permease n=1 Tax=Actinoplanes sp. TBRC 11911 TaxID=2729386 RepID=UPI00145E6139|nr:carbohydrate ABC transporter permease [Actinoplanes sp. TBRC 11911]NMO56835.1 carbohydrate ABC transporter permease [Actinoplanes sp. TBRC 11911]
MNRYRWRTSLLEVVMVLAGLVFVSPIYILFNVAVKPRDDQTGPLRPTVHPTFSNFGDALTGAHLVNAVVNTATVVVVSLIVLIGAASLAGYAIARLTSTWSKAAYLAFLLGLLLPFQLATVPLYQAMRAAGLLGSVWGLVIFYSAQLMPFSVFLYVNFIRALPTGFEEAAQIDGAGPVSTFFRIVFPMMRAVTGTVVILNTINIWNDFFTPRLYLSGGDLQTITVSLYSYVGQYGSDWPLIFGGLILASIPILVLFLILQRYVIKGFAGGLKG